MTCKQEKTREESVYTGLSSSSSSDNDIIPFNKNDQRHLHVCYP